MTGVQTCALPILLAVQQTNTFVPRVNQTDIVSKESVYKEESPEAGAFVDAPDGRGYIGDYVWLDADWSQTPEDDVAGFQTDMQ